MLTLRLATLFASRGIQHPEAFLVEHGFTPRSAERLMSSPEAMSLRHVEQLCLALKCTPDDLFHFDPEQMDLHPSHPLRQLSTRSVRRGTVLPPGLPEEDLQKVWDLIATLLPPVSLGNSRRHPSA